MRQARLCFAGTAREILDSNPAEKLDDHHFIIGLPAVRINGVPFSLVLLGMRVANHVLVFLIQALSKFRVVFVCNASSHYTPSWHFNVTVLQTFLVLTLLSS